MAMFTTRPVAPGATRGERIRQPGARFALACLAVTLLMVPMSASAYVDPNSGGLLFQLLAPLFAAIAGCWMFLRRWFAALFSKLKHKLRRSRNE